MKTNLKLLLCRLNIIILMSYCTACGKEKGSHVVETSLVRIPFYATTSAGTTKSMFSAEEERISDINLWAYRDGVLECHCHRDADTASLALYRDKHYDIYALANTGPLSPPSAEKDVATLTYKVNNYSELFAKGLPMASDGAVKVESYEGMTMSLTLQRLVAKYTLSICRSGDLSGDLTQHSSLTVSSVSVQGAPHSVTPFAKKSKAKDSTIDGDMATELDCNILNAGGKVSFYILENMQGKISGITDQRDKTAESISDAGKNEKLFTYVKVCGKLHYSNKVSDNSAYVLEQNMTYRFYLGENSTDDFNIERNVRYDGRLIYSDFGWSLESFRAEVDEIVEDTNFHLYFCDASGNLVTEGRFDTENSEPYIYFKLSPESSEGITLSCDCNYSDIHLVESGEIESVGNGIFRQKFINLHQDRPCRQKVRFTIANKAKDIKSSADWYLETKQSGIAPWEENDEIDLYY